MKKHNNINSICFRAAFLPAVILVTLALTISGFLFKYHIDNVIERELARHELISQLFVKSANADIIIGNEHSLYIMMMEYTDNYQLQKLLITNQNQHSAPTVINFLKNRQVSSSWLVSGISPERYISIQSKIDANAIIIPLLSSSVIILLFIIASIIMFTRIKRMLHAKIIQPLNQTLTCNGNDITWFDKDTAATEVITLYHRTNDFIKTLHKQRDVIEANNIKQAKYDIALQMAHDIRSPALALETFCGIFDGLADDAKIMLQNVAKRISQIANDVLSDNRISSELTINTTNLSAVAKTIFDERAFACNKKGINFFFYNNLLHPTLLKIPEQILGRIFSNLIINAIESIDRIGQITITLSETPKNAIISICDTGCGIAPYNLSSLFEKGQTIHKPTGNGLGLWSVKRKVLQYSGQIEIISNEGEGTEIIVSFPKQSSLLNASFQ